MSERYSRVFSLPENLYVPGSPVIIAAGTLLKDNMTGKIVGQLKLRSIDSRVIRAVKVRLEPLDTAGRPLGEPVEFDYLDLGERRDGLFGQKCPIPVPDRRTRAYRARVAEVIFGDGSLWSAEEQPWEPLKTAVTLSDRLQDPEMVKQYKIRFGRDCRYAPDTRKDLWHCACGGLNRQGESCHLCGRTLEELQSVTVEELRAQKDARLAEEAAQAAAERAAEAAKRKKRRIIFWSLASAAVLLVLLLPWYCPLWAITMPWN